MGSSVSYLGFINCGSSPSWRSWQWSLGIIQPTYSLGIEWDKLRQYRRSEGRCSAMPCCWAQRKTRAVRLEREKPDKNWGESTRVEMLVLVFKHRKLFEWIILYLTLFHRPNPGSLGLQISVIDGFTWNPLRNMPKSAGSCIYYAYSHLPVW
jgi:hypothetical protein